MIALRLVHLIESHSDQLADGLLQKLKRSSRTADFRNVPEDEIQQRVVEVYRNLSDWLLTKTEADVERVYRALGRRRAEQGISLGSLCWAIMMIEENLWEFLEMEGMREKPLELLGSLELLRLMDQFFDRAVYYSTVEYENYWREKQNERPAALARTA